MKDIVELSITTKEKIDFIDITDKIEGIVSESGVDTGLCIVYLPHATAGLIVGEFEPNIYQDYKLFYSRLPSLVSNEYMHNRIDNNAEAHLLSSLTGPSKTFIVEDGRLLLGTWQRIILCEFDGPRTRRVLVKVMRS